MAYQPAENLNNRTFIGLIIAQFLAGFNDQAIHAVAMFYAIHTKILSEANAITLMPILFYAPWAIFCTLAGYFADRFSKTTTLRIWKVSEIVISLVMIAGFVVGGQEETAKLGGWIVMSCVFMMGTHAAFFAPAKYGAMPEILRPHILSRGNGILESTTFLASILGTVSGGLLFNAFRNEEITIGIILLVLSVIGAVASFLIVRLPAASPDRLFPSNLFKPLVENLKVLFRSRPLALAVLGIAFFVFMVAYMRASMYMHGETRNPRWDEQYTSLIVATVALGVGLGSPLAGYFSGGKVELGLVPIGCLGMIFALLVSAAAMEHTGALVVALIIIGFFSGFYMVPLYTLLQQRAPKKSKGELVATSNFVNVTGAIAASILFNLLVQLGRLTNMTPEIQVHDNQAAGIIDTIRVDTHGRIQELTIKHENGETVTYEGKQAYLEDVAGSIGEELAETRVNVLGGVPREGDEVMVAGYTLHGVEHHLIRKRDQSLAKVYDTEILPRYLFIGAALMTLAILFSLWWKLPDFFVRSLFWFQSLGRFRIKAVGMQNLPMEGPVILACNCTNLTDCLQLVSATDRSTKVILVEDAAASSPGGMLRLLARGVTLVSVRPDEHGKLSWTEAEAEARASLGHGHLLALGVAIDAHAGDLEAFLQVLRDMTPAPILPVFCGSLDHEKTPGLVPRIRVVFGEPMPGFPEPTVEDCKKAIASLGAWIRENDASAGMGHH